MDLRKTESNFMPVSPLRYQKNKAHALQAIEANPHHYQKDEDIC
jgi:hypothetical protein